MIPLLYYEYGSNSSNCRDCGSLNLSLVIQQKPRNQKCQKHAIQQLRPNKPKQSLVVIEWPGAKPSS